jgi:hypothetical protein
VSTNRHCDPLMVAPSADAKGRAMRFVSVPAGNVPKRCETVPVTHIFDRLL